MNYVPKKLNEETMNESINKSLKIPKGDNQNPYVEEELYVTLMPAAHAYGVHISQLLRYSSAYGSHQEFRDRALLFRRKLLNQWSLLVKLKSSLRTFYGRHHDSINHYEIFVSQMTMDVFYLT